MIKGIGMLLAGAAALVMTAAEPASALSTKECSAKYKTAKDAGTLAGKTWNQFRKDECGGATTAPEEKKTAAKAPAEKPAAPNVSSGGAVFPSAVSAKFASQTPSKQRFHTCLEQYNANKAGGGNGGLKWIQKGGGYYSQCNARLKQ